MSIAWYNEFDKLISPWLNQLCYHNLIEPGEVDTRDIADVIPNELRRFSQCHFFAGIGGWSYALRLANWPIERTVWTGSCPCQPFSQAGKRKGFADERHVWPMWYHLINQLRPSTIFGEQVSGPDGEKWFDLISSDLEAIGYKVGMSVLPAACVGAPHRRYRIYFVGKYTGTNSYCPAKKDGRYSTMQVGRIGSEKINGKIFDEARNQWTGKSRPCLLADGIPGRMELMRGYGNAIIPQVAAEFIRSFLETEE